ncbi:hypothetical protein LZG00_06620 [Rhodobacteraceae bacterium LMO-12]|nr:hypothetical protein [Rhodobacteraceae bacterium LMO-JJ12]
MADFTSQFTFSDNIRSGYRRALASISRGIMAHADARSRRSEIEALESRSDAELAAMGIKRDQIVHYVFRDLIHI